MSRIKARLRLFHIWQLTGAAKNRQKPENAPENAQDPPRETGGARDFYSGSFDSIPFLNDDAKRTFVHLLLRPGYMIRDYLRGKRDIYLAPLTSLIIFYAFLALISSIVTPYSAQESKRPDWLEELMENTYLEQQAEASSEELKIHDKMLGIGQFVSKAYIVLHLDTLHDEVDTNLEKSIAAVETALRDRGITRFLGQLISLTLCIWLAFRRRYRFSFSASAATASYILCQFCFFMFFTILITLGRNEDIGALLTGALMLIDFRQLFGISWGRSLWETVKVCLLQLAFAAAILLLVIIILGIMAVCGAF